LRAKAFGRERSVAGSHPKTTAGSLGFVPRNRLLPLAFAPAPPLRNSRELRAYGRRIEFRVEHRDLMANNELSAFFSI
jgi:hypothetical protein